MLLGLEVSQVPMPRFHTSLLNSIRGTNPTRLLIRVHSAAINPVDYKLRAPLLPFIRWIKPNGVARDFSGTVELVIPGNDGCTLKKGDEVFGVAPEGALQEYTITTCAGNQKCSSFAYPLQVRPLSRSKYPSTQRQASVWQLALLMKVWSKMGP